MKFSEGVGSKGDNNCMIGSDMIAIDASGDFSGCYFFTNQKEVAGHTMLGNIFNDQVYIDRYKAFQTVYQEMFDSQEQCKTCDLQNACYQCPAGNIDTGPALFRPDDMCQKIVRMYLDFQKDVIRKQMENRVKRMFEHCVEHGERAVVTDLIVRLAHKYYGITHPTKYYRAHESDFPEYQLILGNWLSNLHSETFNEFNNNYTPVDLATAFVRLHKHIRYESAPFDPSILSEGLVTTCFLAQSIGLLIPERQAQLHQKILLV
jgi:radical SAM protein with 4Fe4S-binding SPASM domain